MTNDSGHVERYLRLLGVPPNPAGLDGLNNIVFGHVTRIPFENISKLLLFDREGSGRPLRPDEFLHGIECYDLGGTCYSCNPFLSDLLKALGYDADLLGADMSEPDVHTCIRVRIGGAEYHVDTGYAAPFRVPIRLDSLPHVIVQGDFRYVLDRRTGDGRYEVSIVSGGERVHGYVVNEKPRAPGFFDRTIVESFEPGQQFMSGLRVSRYFEDRLVELRDRTIYFYKGNESRARELQSADELERLIKEEFGMPRCPVKKAVGILERITGKSFFDTGETCKGEEK